MVDYIIIVLDELDNVGRVISQFSNSAAFNQFTQLIVDWYLILGNGKYDIYFCLSNLVRQLTNGRVILENQNKFNSNIYEVPWFYMTGSAKTICDQEATRSQLYN